MNEKPQHEHERIEELQATMWRRFRAWVKSWGIRSQGKNLYIKCGGCTLQAFDRTINQCRACGRRGSR